MHQTIDARDWHRKVCWVTSSVALSGDLDTRNPVAAINQLQDWTTQGITHIIDVREEWNDQDFVEDYAPDIDYYWAPTDDAGFGQDNVWFDKGVGAIRDAVCGGGRAIVHCHMGINRAPSLTYAYLLSEGYDPVVAATTIRAARPIAVMLYWDSALRWHAQQVGWHQKEWRDAVDEVAGWHVENKIDMAGLISRIRTAS